MGGELDPALIPDGVSDFFNKYRVMFDSFHLSFRYSFGCFDSMLPQPTLSQVRVEQLIEVSKLLQLDSVGLLF